MVALGEDAIVLWFSLFFSLPQAGGKIVICSFNNWYIVKIPAKQDVNPFLGYPDSVKDSRSVIPKHEYRSWHKAE